MITSDKDILELSNDEVISTDNTDYHLLEVLDSFYNLDFIDMEENVEFFNMELETFTQSQFVKHWDYINKVLQHWEKFFFFIDLENLNKLNDDNLYHKKKVVVSIVNFMMIKLPKKILPHIIINHFNDTTVRASKNSDGKNDRILHLSRLLSDVLSNESPIDFKEEITTALGDEYDLHKEVFENIKSKVETNIRKKENREKMKIELEVFEKGNHDRSLSELQTYMTYVYETSEDNINGYVSRVLNYYYKFDILGG
jgi:hypothetical protein